MNHNTIINNKLRVTGRDFKIKKVNTLIVFEENVVPADAVIVTNRMDF